MPLEFLSLVILLITVTVGFIAIFFTTFGTLIIITGTLLYAALTNFNILNMKNIIILFILYLCGEVLEYVFIIIGAKKFGASNAAIAGALIGAILGGILGAGILGIGLLFGTFLGIFLGAFLTELIINRDLVRSLKVGTGGLLGRFGSIIAKFIIAVAMLTIIGSRIISHYAF